MVNFGQSMSDPTTLFGYPDHTLMIYSWYRVVVPKALEIGFCPWKDQIEFAELFICRQ